MRSGLSSTPSASPRRIRKPSGGTNRIIEGNQPLATDRFLEQLLALPTVLAARLSPDGRFVAFSWYRIHENMDVFVVPSDGSAAPTALTHTPEETMLVSWAPDSRGVIVAEDHDGDERVRLFLVDLERPLEMCPLTEDHPPYFIRGGELHPDRRRLFYGANYDVERQVELEPTWIYRHDLQSGEGRAIARPERAAWGEPQLNRQGTHLLYARQDRHPAGRQWYVVDVEGREDREILNFGDAVKVTAEWFPDGERILVLSESRDGRPQQHRSLGVYRWANGEMSWLIDDPARNIEHASVSPDGVVVVDEVREAGHRASWVDAETGTETPFPRIGGNLVPLGRAPDGSTWIGLSYAATAPTELVH